MVRLLISVVGLTGLSLEGLKRVFSRSHCRIVRTCSISDALFGDELARCEHPDILLLGPDFASSELGENIARLRQRFPRSRIVLLAHSRTDFAPAATDADGMILIHSSAAVIVKTLELIALGEKVFPVQTNEAIRSPCPARRFELPRNEPRFEGLSAREAEVFRHLREGSPNKVIARYLGLSEATVKMHVKSILRKTGSRNRTEAALLRSSMEQRQIRPN